jgi:hypothetical protein
MGQIRHSIFDLAEELTPSKRASRKRHCESEPKQEGGIEKAKMKSNMEHKVTTIPAQATQVLVCSQHCK